MNLHTGENVFENMVGRFRDLIAGKRKPSLDDLVYAEQVVRDVKSWITKVFPIGPETYDVLTYKDAIQYFVTERPADPSVAKGAILLQPRDEGRTVLQVFLNKNNDLVCKPNGAPYGRRIVVRQLDAELQATFKDKDLVVIE